LPKVLFGGNFSQTFLKEIFLQKYLKIYTFFRFKAKKSNRKFTSLLFEPGRK